MTRLSVRAGRVSLGAIALATLAHPIQGFAQTADPQSQTTNCPTGTLLDATGTCQPSADAPATTPGTDQPGTAAGSTPTDGDIVVTGSRIARRGTETTSPIQVIDSKQLDTRGFSTVAQALNELPAFGVPGASPVGAGQSSFGAGQSYVDFLGLGSQRTLTLVNGRRFVSSNTPSIFGPTGSGGSQVDLNTIPTKLIDRVETVAAIGAPIYGSDAIAGTINIILKKDYQGLDLDAQYGISERGDAPDYRFRALAGQNFADGRGNITIAGEYNEAKGLLYTDRTLTTSDDRFARSRATTGANQALYRDFRVPSIATTGIPLVGGGAFGLDLPLSPQQANLFLGDPTASFGVAGAGNTQLRFAPDGSLEAINFGSTVGRDTAFNVFTSGGNGLSLPSVQNLLTDLKRYNGNLNATFQVTDKVRLFGEGWYSVSQGRNLAAQPVYNTGLFGAAGTRDGNLIIPLSNPFLSAAARTAIQQSIANNPFSDQNQGVDYAGNPLVGAQNYFYLGRANTDLSPGVSTAKTELARGVIGLDGNFTVLPGREWRFEASFNYGRSKTTSRNPEVNQINFLNALNATRDASGNIVCAPGYTNSPAATISSTCAPLNLFGQQISSAARDYVTTIATPSSVNEQYDGIVSISGPLFKLPGGDVAFALGYEHRQESSRFNPGTFYFGSPDPDPTRDSNGDGDPTNDRGSYGRSTPIDPVSGKFNTDEIFGELNASIISAENDVPFIHELSIQTAGRYVWNSLAGGDPTYTLGGRYAPIRDLTFRGAYTRAIRAPAITEAFNPTSTSFVFAVDVCDQDQRGNGPAPATRAANCTAAGLPANFTALSSQRSFPGYVFGNPNLRNEKSDSYTVGAILTPRFLPGLSATVDYVDITLKDAISQFSTDQVVAACYDSTSYPTNPFCSLITRDGTGQLSLVGTSYFNSAQLRYKGILADVAYRFRTPWLGAESGMSASVSYQYLDTLTTQVTAGDEPTITDNSIGYSRHKGVATVTYDNPSFSYQIQAAYVGSANIANNIPANYYPFNRVNPVVFVNTAATLRVAQQFNLRLSVDNLFDQAPPYPYPASGGTTTYFRGILGRYFRVGAAVHF